MTTTDRNATAALVALIALQAIMLGSLFAGVAPHPPAATPLFAIGPFIGAAIATALAAITVGPTGSTVGRLLSCLAALMALVSFGPQKYFDAQFALIWPAVLGGQLAVAALIAATLRGRSAAARRTLPAAV